MRDHRSRDRLARDLRELGLGDGDVVLVHSSLSGLGWVEGGAGTVIDALLSAVGEGGTVLFPTLTGSAKDGPEAPPHIDLRDTPCWTGAIPEASRHHSGAIRSIHPTHSVTAIGARAEELTRGHEQSASPCDTHSPYVRLMEDGGKILLLGGVTHQSNTSLHALEELARVPYHLQDAETDGIVILPDGRRVTVRNRLHLWQNRRRPEGWGRAFTRVSEPLVDSGNEVHGQVGASRATLISAAGMRDVVLPLLQRDPLHLLTAQDRSEYRRPDVP